MRLLYGSIVYAHVLSAILAIGPLFLLMPIIRRLKLADGGIEQAYLAFIRVIIRLVMHAGHVLVISGITLTLLGPWPWNSSWILLTWAIMLLSVVFLAKGFTSVLKTYGQADKTETLKRLNRTSWLYIGLLLIILWLMVQKPILW